MVECVAMGAAFWMSEAFYLYLWVGSDVPVYLRCQKGDG